MTSRAQSAKILMHKKLGAGGSAVGCRSVGVAGIAAEKSLALTARTKREASAMFLRRLRESIARFMYGRYGMDTLGRVIIWIAVGVAVVNIFVGNIILSLIQTALLVYATFRITSRNIPARSRENAWLSGLLGKFKSSRALARAKHRDRATHVFKKCPSCKNTLRLPRSPGKHSVRCPKCQHLFDVRIK